MERKLQAPQQHDYMRLCTVPANAAYLECGQCEDRGAGPLNKLQPGLLWHLGKDIIPLSVSSVCVVKFLQCCEGPKAGHHIMTAPAAKSCRHFPMLKCLSVDAAQVSSAKRRRRQDLPTPVQQFADSFSRLPLTLRGYFHLAGRPVFLKQPEAQFECQRFQGPTQQINSQVLSCETTSSILLL